MSISDKLILTDCDGVLLNWEYAFHQWMQWHGFKLLVDPKVEFDAAKWYGLSRPEINQKITEFNESAAMGFLPPLRDAVQYVNILHSVYEYRFYVISSMSREPNAGKLRIENLEKIFGSEVFAGFEFLHTGEDKHAALEQFRDSNLWWIEDKTENALIGLEYGLRSILVEHGHNMNRVPDIPKFGNWEDIYRHIRKNT